MKVNERRDDTTKPEAESRPAREEPGSYYYDDATGYETYRPEEDEEEGREDEPGRGETEPAAGG
ncbi:MAG TPA: hypothetical protein VFZ44_11805 [Pyrinomonadaceae bacterium]